MRFTTCLVMLLAGSAASAQTLVVTNKGDATAMLLDLGVPDAEPKVLEVGVGPHEVAISPDGRHAVVANYGHMHPGSSLTLIDLTQAAPPRTISLMPYLRPHGLAFLPDGEHVLVTAELQRSLLKIKLADGSVAGSWEHAEEGGHMVALAPDARFAWVANIGSGSVTRVDLAAKGKDACTTIKTGPQCEAIAISPDGREVWVGHNQAGTISVIDAVELAVKQSVEVGGMPIRITFTPDGSNVLVSSAQQGEVAIIDSRTRTVQHRLNTAPPPELQPDPLPDAGPFKGSSVPIGVTLNGDATRAYVSNTASGTIAEIDLAEFKVVGHRRAGKGPDGIGWSPLKAG